MRRQSTVAFLLVLPLLAVMVGLVAYPAGFALYLSTLNRAMTEFVGLGNFAWLMGRAGFWRILFQTTLFATSTVLLKAVLGFGLAQVINVLPARRQRRWRGVLLASWVTPAAISTLAWRWLFDPSYSAINAILGQLGIERIFWLGETGWARFSVIVVSVWFGVPFFMIMYQAALKSVPEELYEAAAIDGASGWQRLRYVTLPMMRNLIAITMLFSLIGGFTGFDIVAVLTNGGPLGTTHVLATWSFLVGLAGGNLPLGTAIALCMLPILAAVAILILRGIPRRGGG
jgi:multiple sugar transport system permease protein